MKRAYIKMSLLSICLLALFACKKAEPLSDVNPAKLVKLEIRGLILVDTLEFVMDGQVIGTAIDGQFGIKDRLYLAGDKIQIRKKADGKALGEIVVENTPYKQVKKIYYDGTSLATGIEKTPVKDANNMGVRFMFSSSTKLFYGGPVDVEIFVRKRVFNPFETIYTSFVKVKNVGTNFSDFVELPPSVSTDFFTERYYVKFYKAGTQESPYLPAADFSNVPDPLNIYTNLSFVAGESQLIVIQDFFDGNVFSSFAFSDISDSF